MITRPPYSPLMPRSTSARILVALLAGWVQWTFADPTGARSRGMYGVATTAAATVEACHGPAAGSKPPAAAIAHAAHATGTEHAGNNAHAVESHADHVADAVAVDDHRSDAPPPRAHHLGCALCPLACCAGVVLPIAAAPTDTLVAIVATAPTAPWPPLARAATGAAHRLPFATGPPTAG